MPDHEPADALARFRGGFSAAPVSSARLAGLLDAPGCARRRVLAAAGVPVAPLARLLGCPPGRQSPFAHAREATFTRVCRADELAPVRALVRDLLGVPATGVHEADLSARGGTGDGPARRAELTRRELAAVLAPHRSGGVYLLRHPVLPLSVDGCPGYLEPGMLAGTTGEVVHPIEIGTFACLDGVADPGAVAAAARRMAVAVWALRAAAGELGHDPDRVSTRGLLVLPENFSLRPTGSVLDVAPQVARLAGLLGDRTGGARWAEAVAAAPSLPAPVGDDADPPARRSAAAAAAAAIDALPPRFTDGCAGCALFTHCRAGRERAGAVDRLGTEVANLCGPVDTVERALGLAHGHRLPATAGERAVADALSRAAAAAAWVG